MTKTGNTHARRVLVEDAWAYRYPATVSRQLQRRLENQPNIMQDLSWKAQGRLCKRYPRLVAKGKHANGVTVAIARELVGFVWAIAKEVPLPL
jgi:transposase